MRSDPIQFALANSAPSKRPRYVIAIFFEVGSIYCTSHSDITSVPGAVINSVLKDPAAISQRLFPDEGRSEIGSFNFSLVDVNSAFTDAIRNKLVADAEGMRGKLVKFWCGHQGDDFSAFQLFQTQVVEDADYDEGVYTVYCKDLTRSQRKDICEPKFTNLQSNISATDTTISVYDTSAFEMVVHGTSWSDAPSSTVGYLQIEDEKIRYTGKTSTTFTGCTRGVLNTKAVAHSVDAGTTQDRRTKVSEEIYIELPTVKLARAVMTGELYGGSDTLPDHWHLGIDPAFVRDSEFAGIGPDLWNPSDDAAALISRFEGLKKQDGKAFLEKQLFLKLGCFSPVYSDGTLGLRRMPALLGDASPVMTLTEREILSIGPLRHDMSGMHNNLRVNWNYDNAKEEYTRITTFLDEDSKDINGTSDVMAYSFLGLYGSRHTDAIVRERLNSLRDAYAYPPQRTTVTVPGSLSRLELGDVIRLNVANVRDFAGGEDNINRAFMILNKIHRASSNEVSLDLFGSTARPLAKPISTDPVSPLPDAFYTATGTILSTVAAITSNVMATGNYTITGNASLTSSAAVFYWNNNLTIPDGCNLTITGNVQIRVKGFLQINGTINGVGGGIAGTADDSGSPWDKAFTGTAGWVGTTRGYDGIRVFGGGPPTGIAGGETLPAPTTKGKNDAFPYLTLQVSGSTLVGLPADLRGGGGGPGGRLYFSTFGGGTFPGGTGGAGGAGLAIICRGLALGVSASITLNGASTANPSLVAVSTVELYPGAGGPGAPGSMLVLLDGDNLSFPDITGKFFAVTGTLSQAGNAMKTPTQRLPASSLSDPEMANPYSGYRDAGIQTAIDLSNSAHRIQYVPLSQTAAPDAPIVPSTPTGLTLTAHGEFIDVTVTSSLQDADVNQLWASIDNNRANATLVGEGKTTKFTHEVPSLVTRYYWTRVRRNTTDRPDAYSDWYPSSSTAGASTTSINQNGWTPVTTAASGATMVVTGLQIQKSGGTGGWDSQVYSRESFTSGCAVSFRPVLATAAFMIGLNTDPATDAGKTSIDYAWYCLDDGRLFTTESGSELDTGLGYDTSTSLLITYDGVYVRYLRNGVVVRERYDVGQKFFLDSSWYHPGATAAAVQFTPQTTARPIAFIARGNCNVSDSSVIKQGGTSARDSDFYSIVSYSVCHLSFKSNCTASTTDTVVGLSTTPISSVSYGNINFAFDVYDSGGQWLILESGASTGISGSGTNTATLYEVTYDGSNVRYYVDKVLVRTAAASGLSLFAKGSFNYSGEGINSLRFGPTTNLAVIDTGQIGEDAATDTLQSTVSNGAFSYSSISAGSTFFDHRAITSLSYTNTTSHAITIEILYKGLFYLSGAETSGIGRFPWLNISGGVSYQEDTTGYSMSTSSSTAPVHRSGGTTVSIASGASVTAEVMITLRAFAGSYSGIQNANWKDLTLSVLGVKK